MDSTSTDYESAYHIICDYLQRLELETTLHHFTNEWKSKSMPIPSHSTWYALCTTLRLATLPKGPVLDSILNYTVQKRTEERRALEIASSSCFSTG